jgi:1-phosphofructokinase family hexose kinase
VIVTVTPNPSLDRTLTVSRISFDEMIRASGSRLDWGGKGFNVSRALHALGTKSVATGFVGGPTGQMLSRGLAGLGITTDLVPIAGETRTNTIVTEAASGRYIKVNEPGPTVQPEELADFMDRVRAHIRRGDLWALCGSLPPGVPLGFYAQLVRLLQAGGAQTLLDASAAPLALACSAGPFLVKPNAAEAAEVSGREIHSEADALEAVQFFLQQGVTLVALSLGERGLLLGSSQRVVRAVPPRVQVRNPVGAGDALLGGLAWALERRLPQDEVARWGVATGTAAAMRDGVSVGTRAEVQALYERIQPQILGSTSSR